METVPLVEGWKVVNYPMGASVCSMLWLECVAFTPLPMLNWLLRLDGHGLGRRWVRSLNVVSSHACRAKPCHGRYAGCIPKKGPKTKTTHTINMHVCVHEVRIRDFRAVAVIALGPGGYGYRSSAVPGACPGTGGTRARGGTSLGTCPRYTCGTPRGRWPSRCACPWVLGVGECPVVAARRVERGAPSVLGGARCELSARSRSPLRAQERARRRAAA